MELFIRSLLIFTWMSFGHLNPVVAEWFQNEEEDCHLVEGGAGEKLSSLLSGCDDVRAECSASTTCGNCIWSPGDKVGATCLDGCQYCDDDGLLCASIITGSANSVSETQYGDIYTLLFSVEYFFTQGASGSFSLIWVNELGGTCSSTFLGAPCSCTQVYCDEAKSTYNYYVDCSTVEGGAVLDLCNPLTIQEWSNDLTLMEKLVLLPDKVCSMGTGFDSGSTGGTGSGGGSAGGGPEPIGESNENTPTNSGSTKDPKSSAFSIAPKGFIFALTALSFVSFVLPIGR